MRLLREFGLTTIYVGVTIGITLWMSSFSDYMLMEDLGLENSEAGAALLKLSLGERFLLYMSALLTLVGAGGFLVALLVGRNAKREP